MNTSESIYSHEIPGSRPTYHRLKDHPDKGAVALLLSDDRLRSIRRFTNGEWVAEHNYRRNNQLWNSGYKVELYVSACPESYAELLSNK